MEITFPKNKPSKEIAPNKEKPQTIPPSPQHTPFRSPSHPPERLVALHRVDRDAGLTLAKHKEFVAHLSWWMTRVELGEVLGYFFKCFKGPDSWCIFCK